MLSSIKSSSHNWVLKNRKSISFALHKVSILIRIVSGYYADKMLLKALRLHASPSGIKTLKKSEESLRRNLDRLVSKSDGISLLAGRIIILSWPSIVENKISKGVLLVSFTTTFSLFYQEVNTEDLTDYFEIILEPSSSGYADPEILFWPFICTKKIYIQATEVEDRAFLDSIGYRFIPLNIGASNWVNTDDFLFLGLEKKYDSVYVANSNPVKRVDRYLSAVRNIIKVDPEYRSALICADWGVGRGYILTLLRKYDLNGRVDVLFSLTKDQIIRCLNVAKTNVLLSLKEGSNRSLFESMSCNTPVICIYENIGVNKEYINQYTGKLVHDKFLEDALLEMKATYTMYSPRKWLIKNISAERSTDLVRDILSNRPELFVKINNPEVAYKYFPEIKHSKYSLSLLRLFSKNEYDKTNVFRSVMQLKSQFYDELKSTDRTRT